MNGNQTLGRALDILFALAEAQTTLTVTQIAEKVSIPDSTAYRFLQTLEHNGLVERRAKGQIGLGLRILDLARNVHQQIDRRMHDLALPLLEELTEATGETSILAIRSGLNTVCVQSIESHRLIRLSIENGRIMPLYSGATGKAILAFESAKVCDQVLESVNDTAKAKLVSELASIRKTGFSKTVGEVDTDVFGVAAPVFNSRDYVLASITVAGPVSRYDEGLEIPRKVCEVAKTLSLKMGQIEKI
ncbi:IclR family transcriptional regulator [Paenibacillus caui]|uniref:IclR family transcriptional regulator n=1 Tax=Paenibacillus caui TaxID=2873927 RepID=UPI001CA9B338|nr:IclR family transcriptional regulator [Paenibacillus caui]